MSETFDRSQLDGKDRDQLSEIASALGVKSISRMRKADLVEAIVTAAAGSNGCAAVRTAQGAFDPGGRERRSRLDRRGGERARRESRTGRRDGAHPAAAPGDRRRR